MDLGGKVALVTGASRGLGRAVAVALAQNGADVVVTYRSQREAATAVVDEIVADGRDAWVYQLDLGDPHSIDALFDAVVADIGGVDVVICNAAATTFRPLMECEPRHLELTYAISTVGFLRTVQRAVPIMQGRGGGTIIGVSGADTRTYIPAHGVLAGAKAAMESMIRYLACEIVDPTVTILGVNPGTIMGDSIKLMVGEELFEHAVGVEQRTHPMAAAAFPADVAEPIVLLCSPLARWLHGSIVDADGGGVFAMCGRWMWESSERLTAELGLQSEGLGPSVARPSGDVP